MLIQARDDNIAIVTGVLGPLNITITIPYPYYDILNSVLFGF